MPEVIPNSEKHLIRFLYAVRHVERRPATETKRGRPSRWKREDLVSAASHLRAILARETAGRVSLNSFTGQYLAVLDFPPDVAEMLGAGLVNLQEAAQLARLTPARLGSTAAGARARRAELLKSHLAAQGSQTRLRARVKDLLGESRGDEVAEGLASAVSKVDEMLEVDPSDTRHMFWEEMKRLFFAVREVEPEDLDEEMMNDFLRAMDGVSNVLHRLEKRRRKRKSQRETLVI
ncbi:MAG TPA: hypothetical protein VF736_14490 [Pyrinomonadaceae bacterium]|jgi:hypothetical protein